MIDLKRILRGLPKDDPNPATAPYEQGTVVELLKHALETGRYDFTSRRSIRIYSLDWIGQNEIGGRSIEVEWRINE